MPVNFRTFDVFHLEVSTFRKEWHHRNIHDMSVTVDVSTVHLSIESRVEQLSNISDISVIVRSSGLRHLHLPSELGVILYSALLPSYL